jgi:hypothetical protein
MMPAAEHEFDPLAILAVLERNYVNYVLIGGLARVIRGADEVTHGVDISPSFARDSLDRLGTAMAELDARPINGKALTLSDESLAREVIELATSAGELKIAACPAGAPSGFADLRRAATKEHLGHGLQPLVASTGDLARLAAALHRDQDIARLPELRRVMELEVDRQLTATPQIRGPSTASLERLRKLDHERAERSLRLER